MNNRPSIQDHALETMSDAESMRIEDRLWWVRGRKAIIKKYMQRVTSQSPISNIMDIGCGSGGNLDVLGKFGKVFAVEPSPILAQRARNRGIAEIVFQEDATNLDECRDMQLFTMFDVLEHIEGDKEFLVRLRRKSANKHFLLISVPACQFLYSDHDRILHHYRRYSNKTLRIALEEAGYEIQHMSYFMFFLFPLVLFARLREKIMKKMGKKITTVEIGDFPKPISASFAATLSAEAALSRNIRFPIGLWLFALAKSSDD